MITAQQPSRLEQDVLQIVGGDFTSDALGPEYARVVARVHASPRDYLAAFERMFVGPRASARHLSQLHLPTFLRLVADAEPAAVRALVGRLLGQYDTALSVADSAAEADATYSERLPEETSRFVTRLDRRRKELRALLQAPAGPPHAPR